MATTLTRSRPFLRNWPGSQASSPGISASARAGVVTLTERVESYTQKHAAEMAAGRAVGVKAIAEAIVITLPLETRRADKALATAAIDWPAWDVSVQSDALKVRVVDRWNSLTRASRLVLPEGGRRAGFAARARCHRCFQRINDQVPHRHVRHQRRHHPCPGSFVVLRCQDDLRRRGSGQVRLTGTVHSQHDRQIGAIAAWAAPGEVTTITISPPFGSCRLARHVIEE
jgi:hypothetical protein